MIIASLAGRRSCTEFLSKLKSVQLASVKSTFYFAKANMASNSIKPIEATDEYLNRALRCVPTLDNSLHKGQAGRIGIFGGSFEYTGAPFFASISALKIGADLVHVFCCKDAAIPIKSYSPELMVHPVLDDPVDAMKLIEPWLERLHVIIVGPGLGRDAKVFDTIRKLLQFCRELRKPIILDADALFLVSQDISVIENYPGVILTPNVVEFSRIFGDNNDANVLDGKFKEIGPSITILKKGASDIIYNTSEKSDDALQVTGGSGRRCGGQGDILTGCTAVFYAWAILAKDAEASKVACYGASYFLKQLNVATFRALGRSMTATDMIANIHTVFDQHLEHK